MKQTVTWEYQVHPEASHLNVLPDGTTIEMTKMVEDGLLAEYEEREANKFIAENRVCAMLESELLSMGSVVTRDLLTTFDQPVPPDPNTVVPMLRGDAGRFAPLSLSAGKAAGYAYTDKDRCDTKAHKPLDALLKATCTRGQTVLQLAACLTTSTMAKKDAGKFTDQETTTAALMRLVHHLNKLLVDMNLAHIRGIMSTVFKIPTSTNLADRPMVGLSWAAASKTNAAKSKLTKAQMSISPTSQRTPGAGRINTGKDRVDKKAKTKTASDSFDIKRTPSRKRRSAIKAVSNYDAVDVGGDDDLEFDAGSDSSSGSTTATRRTLFQPSGKDKRKSGTKRRHSSNSDTKDKSAAKAIDKASAAGRLATTPQEHRSKKSKSSGSGKSKTQSTVQVRFKHGTKPGSPSTPSKGGANGGAKSGAKSGTNGGAKSGTNGGAKGKGKGGKAGAHKGAGGHHRGKSRE
jgi:hypothetical protein